ETVLDARLICNVVGVTGKGINCRQRVALVAGDKIRGSRKILVMSARQPPAFSVSRAQLGFRGRHNSEPAFHYRASRPCQETRLWRNEIKEAASKGIWPARERVWLRAKGCILPGKLPPGIGSGGLRWEQP